MPGLKQAWPTVAARLSHAEICGAVAHLGQQAGRHAEQGQQFGVPLARVDVEQQGAGGVGRVGGVHGPGRQSPDQEAVDGAEGQLAPVRPRARSFDIVEQPRDLGA
jgi:hypothetical protein